jgi:hypothetical protein
MLWKFCFIANVIFPCSGVKCWRKTDTCDSIGKYM